jgi:hypothetical protein
MDAMPVIISESLSTTDPTDVAFADGVRHWQYSRCSADMGVSLI